MILPLWPLLLGISLSLLLFGVVAAIAFRKTRTIYPVRCVHCWMHKHCETIVSYSPAPDQWAICPECVEHYWRFRHPSAPGPVQTCAGVD